MKICFIDTMLRCLQRKSDWESRTQSTPLTLTVARCFRPAAKIFRLPYPSKTVPQFHFLSYLLFFYVGCTLLSQNSLF